MTGYPRDRRSVAARVARNAEQAAEVAGLRGGAVALLAHALLLVLAGRHRHQGTAS